MMHLLYDLTATQPTPDSKFHGGGTYAEIVFHKLLAAYNAGQTELYAAYDSSRYINPELLSAAQKHDVPLYDIKTVPPADIFRQAHIDRFYSALLDEQINWPLDCAEVIATVHGLRSLEMPLDAIALHYETSFKEKLKTYAKLTAAKKYYVAKVYNGYRRFFSGSLKIVTVSQHSKASILSFFPGINPESVRVFASPSFDQLDDFVPPVPGDISPALAAAGVQANGYFLITSAARWIKNAMRAVFAFDSLFDSPAAGNFKVVLTGVSNRRIFEKQIRHADRFVLLDYVERSELEALHKHAYAFIYPTLNEGFGYPPVEAMKYGVPVAASGTSSVPEVCGNAALYFDPYSVSEIKNRIIQLIDSNIRNEYAERAVAQYAAVSAMQKRDLDALADFILGKK